jgi:hypothetical protein
MQTVARSATRAQDRQRWDCNLQNRRAASLRCRRSARLPIASSSFQWDLNGLLRARAVSWRMLALISVSPNADLSGISYDSCSLSKAERQAMEDALASLRMLKADSLGFP